MEDVHMKIGIANDHAATKMKFELIDYLTSKGYEIVNYGFDTEDSCDYPIAGEKLANGIMNGECEKGIAICGYRCWHLNCLQQSKWH